MDIISADELDQQDSADNQESKPAVDSRQPSSNSSGSVAPPKTITLDRVISLAERNNVSVRDAVEQFHEAGYKIEDVTPSDEEEPRQQTSAPSESADQLTKP